MPNQPNVDALVDMLDHLMQTGSGHVSISADELENELKVSTVKSTDCSCNNKSACMQPTELTCNEDDD